MRTNLSDIDGAVSSDREPCGWWRSWSGSRALRRRRRGLNHFVVGDNLRKGAALNAGQVADELAKRR